MVGQRNPPLLINMRPRQLVFAGCNGKFENLQIHCTQIKLQSLSSSVAVYLTRLGVTCSSAIRLILRAAIEPNPLAMTKPWRTAKLTGGPAFRWCDPRRIRYPFSFVKCFVCRRKRLTAKLSLGVVEINSGAFPGGYCNSLADGEAKS